MLECHRHRLSFSSPDATAPACLCPNKQQCVCICMCACVSEPSWHCMFCQLARLFQAPHRSGALTPPPLMCLCARWGGRMGGQSTSSAEAEGLCQQAHAFAASAGLQLPHPPSSNAPEAHMHAAPVNGTSNVSSRGCAASDPLGTAAAPAQPQPSSSSMEPKPQRNQHAPVQAPSGAAMGAPRTAPHDGPSTAMEPADGCSPSTTGAALAPEQGASSISALTATQPPKGVPRRGGGRKQLTSMRPRPAVPGTGGSTTSPEDPMQGGGSPMAAHPLQHGQPLLSVAQGAAVLQGGPVRSCNPGSREAAARPPLLSPDALSKSTTVQARHGAAESSRQMGVISPAESSRFSGFDV